MTAYQMFTKEIFDSIAKAIKLPASEWSVWGDGYKFKILIPHKPYLCAIAYRFSRN